MDQFKEITKEEYAELSKTGLTIARTIGCRQFDVPSKRDLTFTVDQVITKFLYENCHAATIFLSIFEPNGNRIVKYFKGLESVRLDDPDE